MADDFQLAREQLGLALISTDECAGGARLTVAAHFRFEIATVRATRYHEDRVMRCGVCAKLHARNPSLHSRLSLDRRELYEELPPILLHPDALHALACFPQRLARRNAPTQTADEPACQYERLRRYCFRRVVVRDILYEHACGA